MDRDELRAWLAAPPGAAVPGVDPELLDPADQDDRGLLVRAQHPAASAAVERGDDEATEGDERFNPRMHLLMHEVVLNQLWMGEPPETRRAAERLLRAGHDHHETVHLIGSVVAGQLWSALHAREPVDPDDLAAALDELPGDSDDLSPPNPDDLDLAAHDVDAEDEEAFQQNRDRLVEDFGGWLADREQEEHDWVAHQMLDYKWSHLDGHLGRWRAADLEEVLLELFPRKTLVDAEDLPHVVPAAAQFLRFLDDRRLLSPEGDPLPRLLGVLERLEAPFLERMRDPANFGMGKSLAAGMTSDGVDLTDDDSVQAWIADFNARPEEERRRAVPGPGAGTVLPAMALPGDDVLAAQAVAAPAVRQIAAFLDWVGAGRSLTQKGNLKLADGKALVELLGTGDRVDETIGDRTFATRTTTDLPGVDLVYRLAFKARLVRKHHGSLRTTKRGSRLAQEPLETWRELMTAMLDIGMIGAGREDRYGFHWWADYLEEGVVELLGTVARAAAPLPVDVLAKAAHQGLADDHDLGGLPEVHRAGLPESIARGVGTLVDRLVWMGAATREGVTVERDRWGDERRTGGELALTDLGRWFVRPLLVAQGYEFPVAGALAGATAVELLEGVADWPLEAVHAEVRAWAAARQAPAEELAAVVRQVLTPDLRALGLEALEVIGDDAAPAVRGLTDDPVLRPWATLWLIQRGHGQPLAFDPGDAPAAFVQAFAVALLSSGPQGPAEMLAHDIPVGDQVGIVELLWRVDDPYTQPVLEALAAAEQKAVAKAARKALFKHRSAGPGRRG